LTLLFFYELNIIFDESLYTYRGSIKYYFSLPPKIIRNFPIIKERDKILYHYSAPDGAKPTIYMISYHSTASENMVVDLLEKHLNKSSYTLDRNKFSLCEIIALESRKNQNTIDLYVCADEKDDLVEISLTLYK
jgi:hypothetical protein